MGNADQIVDQITGVGWTAIAASGNKSVGKVAKEAADRGLFVVAGLRSVDTAPRDGTPAAHGHVVIIVSGPLALNSYPTGYWGTLGGEGKRFATINWAWRKSDRDKIAFAYRII
jgi:hypothetical protein